MIQESTMDVAFSASVRAIQSREGSRAAYAAQAERGGWASAVTAELAEFIAQRNSVYLATASSSGRPYVQHRGGPPGFLHVIDERTLAFAELRGNRQYITLGNLAENDRAFLFLMDYAHRRRIKIWGRAALVENDRALLDRLRDPALGGSPERAIVFTIEAWDENCPQHIPRRVDAEEARFAIDRLQAKIAALERENRGLRVRLEERFPR